MFAESLDEMDDSREVVQQLVDEYHAARYSHHQLLPPVRDVYPGFRIRSFQCCGSGSTLGLLYPDPDLLVRGMDPEPDPSIIKQNSKKNPGFYCFVTSFWVFTFEKWCKSTFKKSKQKNFFLHYFSVGILKVNDPDPLVRGMDPRIRIHTEMSWIRNTGSFSIPDPGSRIRIKEFKYFNPKIVSKLSEIWSGLFIPDPDPDFYTHPGFRFERSKGTGFGSETLALKSPTMNFRICTQLRFVARCWREKKRHLVVFSSTNLFGTDPDLGS
jgi:hypothetical protein